VKISCQYGLEVYQIYSDGFHLAALGLQADKGRLKALIGDYDQTWATFTKLKQEHASCATLYEDKAFLDKPGMGAMVDELRKAVG